MQVLLALPTGKRLRVRPRTRWSDYISDFSWSRLSVEPAELSEIAVDREVSRVLLGLLPRNHGRNLVGDTGMCVPNFVIRWGYNMPCPPHFSLFWFCILRGFKNKSDVCLVLCEELFMLDQWFPNWGKLPPEIICDSLGGNVEPKPQCCSIL